VIPGTRSRSVSALAKLIRPCNSIRATITESLWSRPVCWVTAAAASKRSERKRGGSVNRMKNQRRCCFLRSLGLVSLLRFDLCKTAVEFRFGVVHCQFSEERHWVDHVETGESLAESIVAHQIQ
jgi:hypothetical protein